jgi:hypothetical protein
MTESMAWDPPCHSFQSLVANTPLLATTKTLLSERLINGSDGPAACAPSAAQPHPMLPHQPGPPHPDHNPTASTIKGNVTADDPASVEKKYPISPPDPPRKPDLPRSSRSPAYHRTHAYHNAHRHHRGTRSPRRSGRRARYRGRRNLEYFQTLSKTPSAPGVRGRVTHWYRIIRPAGVNLNISDMIRWCLGHEPSATTARSPGRSRAMRTTHWA